MSYAYPIETKEITCIIYDYLKEEELEIIEKFGLKPFSMKVQTISRTFIDKLFAVCDYYMLGKSTRNSRHLYDIYKLKDQIIFDKKFYDLVEEVRNHRSKMDINIAPSAKENVNIADIGKRIVKDGFYKRDYHESTEKLIFDHVFYEDVIDCYSKVMEMVF